MSYLTMCCATLLYSQSMLRPDGPILFFFTGTATTEIYTLSLHDALPILTNSPRNTAAMRLRPSTALGTARSARSEEHTSELQSLRHLVCRLLLEKKKNSIYTTTST